MNALQFAPHVTSCSFALVTHSGGLPCRIPRPHPPPVDVTAGVLVRRFRRGAGWSQEELAARATLSVRTLSNLERGAIRKPQAETLRLITDALGLSSAERALLEARVARRSTTAAITGETRRRTCRPRTYPRR